MSFEVNILLVAGRMTGTQFPTLLFQLMGSTLHAPLADGSILWMSWLKMLKAAGEYLLDRRT